MRCDSSCENQSVCCIYCSTMSRTQQSDKDYDVFLTYNQEYDDGVAKQVYEFLEADNFKVIDHRRTHEVFKYGNFVFNNIENAINKARTTVAILSQESLKSKWLTFEIILALEKAQRTRTLCVRLLLVGVDEEKIQYLNSSDLQDPRAHVYIDSTQEWELRKLAEVLRAPPVPADDILVSGDVALGQVYNYYGYLEHVLPCLPETLQNWCQENPKCFGKVSTKYYVLLPESCDTPAKLHTDAKTEYPRIEFVDSMLIHHCHAGKQRDFKPSLYRIVTQNQEYYFVAEYPHVLNVLSKIEKYELAPVNKWLQMGRFFFTTAKVCSHIHQRSTDDEENQAVPTQVELLRYDDTVDSVLDVLLKRVSKDVRSGFCVTQQVHGEDCLIRNGGHSPQQIQRFASGSTDVNIVVDQDISEDAALASEIERALTENSIEVVERGRNRTHFWEHSSAKWQIFILSKMSLKSLDAAMPQLHGALQKSVDENRVQVVPVLSGIQDEDIPKILKWVTYLNVDEKKHYIQQLIDVVKGGNITMEMQLPVGDVATGLAWGTLFNYLPITLLGKGNKTAHDFCGRITDFVCKERKKISCPCLPLMYMIVPKTCNCNRWEEHSYLKSLGKMEPVVVDAAGTAARPYDLCMFEFTRPSGEKICFLMEYAAPAYTMSKMVKLTGLQLNKVYEQSRLYANIVHKMLRNDVFKTKIGDMQNMCRVVYFDDDAQYLQQVLETQIEKDLKEVKVLQPSTTENERKQIQDMEIDGMESESVLPASPNSASPPDDEHMQPPLAKKSKLSEEEIASSHPADLAVRSGSRRHWKASQNSAILSIKEHNFYLYIKGCTFLLMKWLAREIGTDAPTNEEEKKLILEACCPPCLNLPEYSEDSIHQVYDWLVDALAVNHLQQVATHRAWIMWTYKFLDMVGVTFAGQMDKQALLHDLSKFSPEEILGYAIMFGPEKGFRKIDDRKEEDQWMLSLNHHYDTNPHHPEYFYPKNEAGVREKRDLLDQDQGHMYLEESIIDMLACRAERELADDPEIKVEKWMYIADNFLKRYTDRDRMWVQEKVKEWLEKMKEFLSNQQSTSQTADLFKGKPILL